MQMFELMNEGKFFNIHHLTFYDIRNLSLLLFNYNYTNINILIIVQPNLTLP